MAGTRTRSTTTPTARWRATASYYPYFQNLNTAAVGSNYSWFSGAFANPSYTTNLFWLTVTYKFDPPPQVYVAPRLAEAPKPVVAPPAAAAPARAAASAGPAGAEDHARLEGAVRLRQGGPDARREGGDRQPGRDQARAGPEARGRHRDGAHRSPGHGRLQPEAVGRTGGGGGRAISPARVWTRRRSRPSGWARSSRSCSAIRRTRRN